MAGRVFVPELTKVLAKTYRAIDVRIAALRESDTWVSGLTVVRLSYDEPAAVEKRLCSLQDRYNLIATENFKILLESLSFSEWDDFCAYCFSGIIRLSRSEIKLRQPIDISSLAGEIRPGDSVVRAPDNISWPGIHVAVGNADTRLSEERLIREVGPLGYSSPLEAINELCELNVFQGRNPGQEFYLSVPVFARLESARLSSADNRLDVKIRKHVEIVNLFGTAALRRPNFNMEESSSYRKPLSGFEVTDEAVPIQGLTASAKDLPHNSLESWVEIKLVHSTLGEIQQWNQPARDFIPSTERDVLFAALKHFCPEARLERLVVNPTSTKPVKLKTSAAFELHVGWLLGLCGFSTIMLGEYESVIDPETNIVRGSVDLLAYKPRSEILLLVACTLLAPKEDDFGNLLNVRRILQREVFEGTTVRILPVIFTGARGQASSRSTENDFLQVPIVDADRIEIVLSLIREGSVSRFFEFLLHPGIFKLNKPEY